MHASSTKETIDSKHHIKAAVNHLEEGGRRIKKDAQNTADHVQGDLASLAHNVGEQVREFVETAGEGLAQAKDSISDAGDSVATQISENPLKAGLVFLGLGIALGVLLRR